VRIIAKENENSLPVVSSRYRHVNTLDVHNVLRDNGFQEKGYREANVRLPERQGFQKHMSIFHRPEMRDGDHGDFNVMLFNGHDGSTAIRLELGYFRLICENQLINSELGFKVAHTGNVLERLNSRIPILLKGYEDFRALKERMESKDLKSDQLRELLTEAVRIRQLDGMHLENESVKGQVIEYNLKAMDYTKRHDDRGLNAWRTLNRVQENMIRGTTWDIATTTKAGEINYRKLRAITNLDRVIQYNKQLTAKAVELLGAA
jgi:hypothetical protein